MTASRPGPIQRAQPDDVRSGAIQRLPEAAARVDRERLPQRRGGVGQAPLVGGARRVRREVGQTPIEQRARSAPARRRLQLEPSPARDGEQPRDLPAIADVGGGDRVATGAVAPMMAT